MSSSDFPAPLNADDSSSQPRYDPSAFLHEITGSNVIVKINSGVEYHGRLGLPLCVYYYTEAC